MAAATTVLLVIHHLHTTTITTTPPNSNNNKTMFGSIQAGVTRMMYGANRSSLSENFFSISDKLIDGTTSVSMKEYKGNAIVVVNVASQ